jgi:transposase InsO family protein
MGKKWFPGVATREFRMVEMPMGNNSKNDGFKRYGAWLSHYNQTRLHSTFNGQTPDEVYHLSHLQRPDPEDTKQAA